jgi:putative transposase
MNTIYRAIGTSKQNIHQRLNRTLDRLEEVGQIRAVVGQVREDHPGMGAKDLYRRISPKTMGRDRFIDWYRTEGLTIKPQKNWRRTTDSSGVIRFPNLTLDQELTGVNQVWVSDITYYEIDNRFYYLTFVMDQYSRLIKGFHASKTLRTEQTTLPALQMAMKYLSPGQQPIIHSDGGGQYYSKSFLNLTTGRFFNSMGKSAYENPYAERLNRTIKNSYLKYYQPSSFEQLITYLKKAVNMYNDGKPHQGLKGLTPKAFELKLEELQTNV